MGALFGGGKPKPTPVTRMPDPEDPDAKDAQARALQAYSANRGGRASTVLSGVSYSGSRLGSTGR